MQYVKVRAPGKVNLALRVGAPRPDGFHPLDTVFEALDIYEELEAWEDPSGEISLEYDPAGFGADLPVDESNLAIRAAHALLARVGELRYGRGGAEACRRVGDGGVRSAAGVTQCEPATDRKAGKAGGTYADSAHNACRGARMRILKRIPIAGGMAGGSADAAAALVALNKLWELGLGDAELAEIGAGLGSDVPFVLMGGVARGTSRGEDLTAISARCAHGFVMLVNSRGLSTPAVFREFDRLTQLAEVQELSDSMGQGSLVELSRASTEGLAEREAQATNGSLDGDADGGACGVSKASASRIQGEPSSTAELCAALVSGGVRDIAPLMKNDLEEPAFSLRNDLREIIEKIRVLQRGDQSVGEGVILSGSGPTIAVLCEPERTGAVAAQLQRYFPELTAICANGPARGAHVTSWHKLPYVAPRYS